MKQYSVGKWLMWLVVVLLPAIAVAISNKKVFPSSLALATILLSVSVLASIIILYYADRADPAIGWYCVIVEGLLSITIFINFGCHFQLSREIDEAIISTGDRHSEEDRNRNERDKEAKIYQDCLDKFTSLQRSIRRDQRSGAIPCATPKPQAVPQVKITSRENALAYWNPYLTWLAFAEAGIAILGGFGLGVAWRWDQDKNGVPDWADRLARKMPKDKFASTFPVYASKLSEQDRNQKSEQDLDIEQSPSPRIIGFSRDIFVPETVPNFVPENAPEMSQKSRPLAVRNYGTKTGQKTGQNWVKILGHFLPILDEVRWQGRRKRKTIECWTKDKPQSYLGLLNEEILNSLSAEKPERMRQILALIDEWKIDLEQKRQANPGGSDATRDH